MKEVNQYFYLAFIVFSSSYLINLLWEVAHSALYDWNKAPLQNSVYYYIPRILYSTLGDAVVIALLFGFLVILNNGMAWIHMPQAREYAVFVVAGIFFAVLIELRAMAENRWSYSQYMPVVLGIGLTPLIQLAVTGLVTLFVVRRLLS